jgi:hypothetical protein
MIFIQVSLKVRCTILIFLILTLFFFDINIRIYFYKCVVKEKLGRMNYVIASFCCKNIGVLIFQYYCYSIFQVIVLSRFSSSSVLSPQF